jgi:hypothetical protein
MYRWFIIGFLFSGFVLRVSGQPVFLTNTPVNQEKNGLYFKFENAGFFKNNEFESDVVKGYTLTGDWVLPKFVFIPSEKVQLELGWFYLKYNGAEKASYSTPWFSARINFYKNWQFILGNLNNSNNHKLISPIWEPERFLTDKPEAGFQIRQTSEKLYFDTWINWEQFIVEGDPFQEHFTAGLSFDYRFLKTNNFNLSLPIQVLAHHQGGEIDSSPLHVRTLMNLAAGIKTEIPLTGFFRQVNLSGYFLGFKDARGTAGLPFKKGSGFYSSNSVETKAGKFGFEFWDSKNFYSIKGTKLLQPVSGINSLATKTDLRKEMFSLFYDFSKEVYPGINFGFKFEGWFEPDQKYFSNMAALYIIVNQDFFIKKF